MTARRRVTTTITGKDGQLHKLRIGHAFVDEDGTIQIYLDAPPLSGKLTVETEDGTDATEARNAP